MDAIMTKKHRYHLFIPSRWHLIILCFIPGLLMSIFVGANFAGTKIVPATSLSSSSKSFIISTTMSINQILVKFLSGSSCSNTARLCHGNIPHLLSLPPVQARMNLLKDENTSQTDNGYEGRRPSIRSTHKQPMKTKTAPNHSSLSTKAEVKQHASGVHEKHPPYGPERPSNFNLFSSLFNSDSVTCDFSNGKWIQDDAYPLYDPGSCPFVEEAFNCHSNGRPDREYAKWRWAPRNCNVPRFNGTSMLERMKGKRVAFVGDSLNRNQWESLVCMLRESLPDKGRVVQLEGKQISKMHGGYGFKFLDYNFRVELFVSPYLVDMQEASNAIKYIIRLDKMDRLERRWRKADVLVFNTGHWWTSDKIGYGEECFQEGGELHQKLDVMVAYKKALSTWAKWVDSYVDPQKTAVFFRGYSPVHYMGGQWSSGGQCQNETEPIYEESYLLEHPDKMQALESVVQGMRVPVYVLNITRLSDFRKDAHPAVFGRSAGQRQGVEHQDCSHWCLPGVPDTWNELLSFALLQHARR